jgi:ATP-binding cassette subfamily F protein uup
MLPEQMEQTEAAVEAQQAVCGSADFYQRPHEEVTAELEKLSALEAQLEAQMERWMELEAMAEG